MKSDLKFFAFLLLVASSGISAQVGIGTTTPDASAVLDVTSTTKGFLLPRMTYLQRTAIVSPAAGLQVWCTDCGNLGELQTYNGIVWITYTSVVANAPQACGAYIAPGVYKAFACYNLGTTDTTLDPNVPVQAIHGNYYQWGSATVVATNSTPSGAIAGWNTVGAANDAWLDASKTANDPCPAGFRIPTSTQWAGVIANNTVSRTGSWANDGNFTTAIHWGPDVSTKSLTLPAAGIRIYYNGQLFERGSYGSYCSSTAYDQYYVYHLGFGVGNANSSNDNRNNGLSMRCISQ